MRPVVRCKPRNLYKVRKRSRHVIHWSLKHKSQLYLRWILYCNHVCAQRASESLIESTKSTCQCISAVEWNIYKVWSWIEKSARWIFYLLRRTATLRVVKDITRKRRKRGDEGSEAVILLSGRSIHENSTPTRRQSTMFRDGHIHPIEELLTENHFANTPQIVNELSWFKIANILSCFSTELHCWHLCCFCQIVWQDLNLKCSIDPLGCNRKKMGSWEYCVIRQMCLWMKISIPWQSWSTHPYSFGSMRERRLFFPDPEKCNAAE